jgi:hypothetical protein
MGIDNIGMELNKKGMEVDTNEAINISNDIQNDTLTLMR